MTSLDNQVNLISYDTTFNLTQWLRCAERGHINYTLFILNIRTDRGEPGQILQSVWPAKPSLYIHWVWQGFLFITLWIARRVFKAHAIGKDSDQTARMLRRWHMSFCRVFPCAGIYQTPRGLNCLPFILQLSYTSFILLYPTVLHTLTGSKMELFNLEEKAVNQYCGHSFARQLPFLNQRKGENDRRKYFMINLRERMLPTSAGVTPVLMIQIHNI